VRDSTRIARAESPEIRPSMIIVRRTSRPSIPDPTQVNHHRAIVNS
jgi:hypothetical protein